MIAANAMKEPRPQTAQLRMTSQEAQVIDALRRQMAVSRTDISRVTSWSRPKVTTVIEKMINRGLLEEVGEGESQGGRRPRLLRLNSQLGYVVGVDIGATSMDLALADLNGQVMLRDTGPANVRDEPEVLLGEVKRRLTEL